MKVACLLCIDSWRVFIRVYLCPHFCFSFSSDPFSVSSSPFQYSTFYQNMSTGNPSTYISSSPLPCLYPAVKETPAIMNSMNNAHPYHITSGAGMPLPTTYTPTTHRVSKAKKGKRVHVCEYPGCQKVCLLFVSKTKTQSNLAIGLHSG